VLQLLTTNLSLPLRIKAIRMIDLNILEEAAQQQSIQQAQQSSIAQKAVESAQQPDHYPEDVQGILDEIKAAQERDAIRRRIAVYNYACGGNMHAAGGGIHIDPSKRGTFTAAASRHGMGVQAFASKVLANKDNYSPAMVKKANFARNASKFHHAYGGNLYGRGGTISHQEGRIKNILDKYLSVQRKENIDPGTELYDSTLLSSINFIAFLGVADNPSGEGPRNLLEEYLSILVSDCSGGMFVFL
jgi:hypothetical protein